MIKRIIGSLICIVMILSLVFTLAPAQIAIAMVGPTNTIPGGVTILDNDPGNGEQWGRTGGRTLIFSGIDTSLFTELYWGSAEVLEVVKIAFDGAYGDPGETLTYQTLSSNPSIGVLVWEGSTHVTLDPNSPCNGTYPIPTRFTLTITDALGAPVSLVPVSGMSLPKVDVINLTPVSGVYFYATLEMEAVNPVSCYVAGCPLPHTPQGQLGPALDVYDCLNTAPPAGKALTYFNYGFYYEAVGGVTLDQVATAVEAIEVKVDEGFSVVNWIAEDYAKFAEGMRTDHDEIKGGINALEWKLDAQATELGDVNTNTQGIPGQISSLSDQITQINNILSGEEGGGGISQAIESLPNMQLLLLLFGIEASELGLPEDPNLPPGTLDWIKPYSDLYQSLRNLEVQVINVQDKQRFLLLTTEAGQPVSSQLVSLQALTVKGKNPVEVQDVTAYTTSLPISSGILDVAVDLPKSAKDAEVFVFTVEHNGVFGSIMIDKKGDSADD